MGKILVVDDEQSMREFLSICLRRAGHEVAVASSPKAALDILRDKPIDLVLTDLKMPGEMDGLALLKLVKAGGVTRAESTGTTPARVDPEVILLTAFATADTAIAAMKDGAYDYLTKPFPVDELNAVIGRAMEKRALVEDNAQLRDQLAGRARLAQLLGKSRAMQKVFELIGKIHSTKTNVLVTGESGTGKELVSRALHSEGVRAKHSFVAVNCGAIPEELMESELFGHKKGAFTGAVADKRGLFQEAEGGTLFLDEIGELSLSLQVKLLRALQERKVKAVGATEELEVDVRVVAATNRDLEAEVARGAFRSDLYYRLNVIELRLPPLRMRREDVPLLVEHFLKKFGTEHGRIPTISAGALRKLEGYAFPGNVRELENMIERAVALASGPIIEPGDLPELKGEQLPPVELPAKFPVDGVELDQLVSNFEREWITRALDATGGVRKKAAQLLGISFRSMRYRLVKLGMDKDEDSATPDPADADA